MAKQRRVKKADEPLVENERGATALGFAELGVTGLTHSLGVVQEEFLNELRNWTKAAKIYKEMSWNDPVIGAILFVTDMLVRRVKWSVEAPSEDPVDVERTKFTESCLDDMSSSWSEIISEIFSFVVYGWQYSETVYKRRLGADGTPPSKFNDGLIGWKKIAGRSQDTLYEWRFSENGDVKAMIQQDPNTFRMYELPIEKCLLFRNTIRKNNPMGQSVLRNAYRPWYIKKRIENIEAVGIERDLAGMPVFYVPSEWMGPDATVGEKAAYAQIKKIIRNIKRDQEDGVAIPSMFDDKGNRLLDFKLVSASGSRQFDTNEIVYRYDQRIAMVVIADFVLLGHKNVGSLALASSKTEMYVNALGSWLDMVAAVFNRYAIPRLYRVNGWTVEKTARLVPGDIETQDLRELGEFFKSMSVAGLPLFPNEELEKHIFQQAGLPWSGAKKF